MSNFSEGSGDNRISWQKRNLQIYLNRLYDLPAVQSNQGLRERLHAIAKEGLEAPDEAAVARAEAAGRALEAEL